MVLLAGKSIQILKRTVFNYLGSRKKYVIARSSEGKDARIIELASNQLAISKEAREGKVDLYDMEKVLLITCECYLNIFLIENE